MSLNPSIFGLIVNVQILFANALIYEHHVYTEINISNATHISASTIYIIPQV